jgi:hypothetical protein
MGHASNPVTAYAYADQFDDALEAIAAAGNAAAAPSICRPLSPRNWQVCQMRLNAQPNGLAADENNLLTLVSRGSWSDVISV